MKARSSPVTERLFSSLLSKKCQGGPGQLVARGLTGRERRLPLSEGQFWPETASCGFPARGLPGSGGYPPPLDSFASGGFLVLAGPQRPSLLGHLPLFLSGPTRCWRTFRPTLPRGARSSTARRPLPHFTQALPGNRPEIRPLVREIVSGVTDSSGANFGASLGSLQDPPPRTRQSALFV